MNELANVTVTAQDGKNLTIVGKGHLLEFSVFNGNAATRYLMLFDTKEVPRDGMVPKRKWTITTLQTFDGVFPHGRPFRHGLALIMSSTLASLTQIPQATDGDALMEATCRLE